MSTITIYLVGDLVREIRPRSYYKNRHNRHPCKRIRSAQKRNVTPTKRIKYWRIRIRHP